MLGGTYRISDLVSRGISKYGSCSYVYSIRLLHEDFRIKVERDVKGLGLWGLGFRDCVPLEAACF